MQDESGCEITIVFESPEYEDLPVALFLRSELDEEGRRLLLVECHSDFYEERPFFWEALKNILCERGFMFESNAMTGDRECQIPLSFFSVQAVIYAAKAYPGNNIDEAAVDMEQIAACLHLHESAEVCRPCSSFLSRPRF